MKLSIKLRIPLSVRPVDSKIRVSTTGHSGSSGNKSCSSSKNN